METRSLLKRLTIFMLSPLVALALFTACSDDGPDIIDPGPEPRPDPELNIVETAGEDGRFTTLIELAGEAGLAEALASEELTLFAPTDAAFDALFETVNPDDLSAEEIAEILSYHVTSGVILSGSLEAQQDVEMLNEELTLVQAGSGGVTINGSAGVTDADVEATNGVIHVIDEVLLPSTFREASVVEAAQDAGNYEILLELVEGAGLTTTLQFLGPYTVFAPNDEAFEALFENVNPADLSDEQIEFILTYHLLGGVPVFSTDLAPQQTVSALNDEALYIMAENGEVRVNATSSVVAADIEVANGVIHAVDEVLLPNIFVNIPSIITKNYDLTTLLELVADREAILEALSDENAEYTVFAPTNAAFEEALNAFPDLTEEEITEILTYHVLTFEALAGDLSESQVVETLQGEDLLIEVENGTVLLNGSSVVEVADLTGTNGTVHIINEVILPASFGGGPPADAVDASITINNVGSSSWVIEEVEGEGAEAELNEENTPLTLEEGGRYTIVNLGSSNHPLQLRDSDGDVLIAAAGDGSLQDYEPADVVVNDEEGSITFTLTGNLADWVATYNCQPHAAMEGEIIVN
jgi:transforming growth factor-beta-induced protein